MREYAFRIGLIVMLSWMPCAVAQPSPESEIRNAITRQLDALNRGDEATAFAIASPAIQAMFENVSNFMQMVQQRFPQVHRSRRHQFLKLGQLDNRVIQRVLIESDAGTVVARYHMVEIDGSWRIDGCVLERAEGA